MREIIEMEIKNLLARILADAYPEPLLYDKVNFISLGIDDIIKKYYKSK